MDQPYSSTSAVQVQRAQQPPKFSRYRSVRKAAASSTQHSAPPPLPTVGPNGHASLANSQNESIQRSMSRYKHAKPTKIVTSIPPPPLPPSMPALQNGQYADIESWIDRTRRSQEATRSRPHSERQDLEFQPPSFPVSPKQSFSQPTSPRFGTFTRILGMESHDRRQQPGDYSSPNSSGEEHSIASKGFYVTTSDIEAEPRSRGRSETSRLRSPLQYEHTSSATVSPVDVARTTREELLANEKAAALHNGSGSRRKIIKDKGGLLSKIKGSEANGSSRAQREARGDLKNLISSPTLIDPSQLQNTTLDDTPVSAVNAGERKVLVTCNDSFINLPVTPTTTAQDLLYSAANCLSEEINPKSAVLTESFQHLGLQRPLRRYEHVRDVMNSWDADTQNHLEVIAALEDDDVYEGLDVRSAPRKQPKDTTFHIYHCQGKGKWDKRYITLRADGQVLMSKKQGGETANLCHMSDFDIYYPKKREYRRIKPPKKLCYVIKSQQKASMFLSSDNFSHMFSMSDSETGRKWYRAIQEWRSWYLVSVMGEGKKEDKPDTSLPSKGASGNKVHRDSEDSTPYQLGTFKPLVDMDALANEIAARPSTPPAEEISTSTKIPAQAITSPDGSHSGVPHPSQPVSSHRGRHETGERVTEKKRGRSQTATSRKPPTSEEPFMSAGLLGRTYTLRQNAMREREKELAEQNNPFTTNGLLNNLDSPPSHSLERSAHITTGPPSRENTIRSPSGRNRSLSIQQAQKPLVDLTPTYIQPPQHAKKGRGVAAQPGTLLIDNATGPELCPGAIAIPPATVWRRPGQRSGTMTSQVRAPEQFSAPRGRQRSNTMRSTQYAGAKQAASPPPEVPFIPTGLLAQEKFSQAQGAAHTGRGIATGNRQTSGRPLLDLAEPSQFAEGSLLRNV